eukprot:TRINITY_DN12463_c0_g2_i1.p1 TRINITY_DN12463_c0_g2~~TRINITY_DN12463_c0_g2_i1.p1  ORF type:complete len:638 (+),score=89.32 TRINITY_DN12463_c0_g2_i1:185-2098(+)
MSAESERPHCHNCGQEAPARQAAFCWQCGAALSAATRPEPSTPAVPDDKEGEDNARPVDSCAAKSTKHVDVPAGPPTISFASAAASLLSRLDLPADMRASAAAPQRSPLRLRPDPSDGPAAAATESDDDVSTSSTEMAAADYPVKLLSPRAAGGQLRRSASSPQLWLSPPRDSSQPRSPPLAEEARVSVPRASPVPKTTAGCLLPPTGKRTRPRARTQPERPLSEAPLAVRRLLMLGSRSMSPGSIASSRKRSQLSDQSVHSGASWHSLSSPRSRADQLQDEGLPEVEATELSQLLPGARIEFAHLEAGSWQKLGSGDFGSVWKCNYTVVRETVAVKELHSNENITDVRSRNRRAAFVTEIMNASLLRFNSIVNFYGWTLNPTNLHVLMITELCIESLHRRLRSRPLPCSELVSTALAVAKAALYIHTRQMVHMDIAARNVLLSRAGAKLGDLGLCTLDGSEVSNFPVLWSPPEVLACESAGRRPVAHRSCDSWSFGVLVWEMLHRPTNKPYAWLQRDSWGEVGGPQSLARRLLDSVLSGERLPIPDGPCAVLLRDCLVSCWAEDMQERRTMEGIVDCLCALDKMKLSGIEPVAVVQESQPAEPLLYPYLSCYDDCSSWHYYVSPENPVRFDGSRCT